MRQAVRVCEMSRLGAFASRRGGGVSSEDVGLSEKAFPGSRRTLFVVGCESRVEKGEEDADDCEGWDGEDRAEQPEHSGAYDDGEEDDYGMDAESLALDPRREEVSFELLYREEPPVSPRATPRCTAISP
jgi:hypothetical protein